MGDYETTVRGMERSAREPLGPSDDRDVSTAFWLYLAHRKLGRHEEAQAIVDAVPDDWELIENFTYYDSVLFFNGTRTAEELLPEADSLTKFAIAMVYHFRGEQAQAEELWLEAVNGSAQGFWPAEAELLFAEESAGS